MVLNYKVNYKLLWSKIIWKTFIIKYMFKQ